MEHPAFRVFYIEQPNFWHTYYINAKSGWHPGYQRIAPKCPEVKKQSIYLFFQGIFEARNIGLIDYFIQCVPPLITSFLDPKLIRIE